MRLFNTSDVFAMARVVRASGIRAELRDLVSRAVESDTPAQEIGIEGFLTILEALAEKKAEVAIYEVLAGPMELTANEVAGMPLTQLAENFKQMAEENDLKRFFDYVSGILGKN